MYLLHIITHSGYFHTFAVTQSSPVHMSLCITAFYPHQIVSKKHFSGSKGVYILNFSGQFAKKV